MVLKKPSDLFNQKETSGVFQNPEVSPHITESYNKFLNNFEKVNHLSEKVELLSQELTEKLNKGDLENAMLSQLMILDENFKSFQNQIKGVNKKDLKEFKQTVSDFSQVVENLIENEIPKYKKQVTKNELFVEQKVSELNETLDKNITDIKDDLYEKLDNVVEIVDDNLENFNQQLKKTSSEVIKTADTYKNISHILENKVLEENQKFEEYSSLIENLQLAFIEFKNLLSEETNIGFENLKNLINEKVENVSDAVNQKVENLSEDIENNVNEVNQKIESIENKVSNEISGLKADVVIFEKHNKKTSKKIDEFSTELEELNTSYKKVEKDIFETRTDLKIVETYISKNHKDIQVLKEEVYDEINNLPIGNLSENIERIEKKIDFIRETYSKINPEEFSKEIIKEGLLNEPPNTKNRDPLTPLDKKFVTLDQLQEHYRLFINRIQQQLSTLGGSGETQLKYLDDIVGIATNASAYDGKYLTYNHTTRKFVFDDINAANIQDLDVSEENIVYVAKDGNDNNPGTLTSPKLTIKSAVGIAITETVIRVAPGTYFENNPITLPDNVTVMGHSLRETTVIPLNDDEDLFYVGNGNYVAEMSFRGSMPGKAVFAFDPINERYIDQSPYIQNCTNFIPDSIGMRIDGKEAIGPIKSMVLDSYTQYNQGGIGVSITNEGYAQLVSLFTICDDIAVYCGSGAACDLTNSNSSFGNYGLVADGVSPKKFTGIVTVASAENADSFVIDLSVPTLNVVNADYNNETGRIKITVDQPHKFNVGMGVSIVGLAFTCPFEDGFRLYPSGSKGYVFNVETVAPGRYLDAANLIVANTQEIVDKSLAQVAVSYANTNFYFPGETETNARSRYYDATRLIQKNKQEIVDKALASIAVGFPTGFKFPDDPVPYEQNRYYDASRLITINKQEIVDKSLASIAVGFPTGFKFPDDPLPYEQNRYYDASRLITLNKQEIVDKSLAAVAVGFPNAFTFPGDTNPNQRYYDASRLITINKQEIVDKSLAAVAIAHSDFYFPGDETVGFGSTTPRSRYYDAYRLIQRNKDVIVGAAWSATSSAYSQFNYTETKCKRDIGFFIDAVSTDVFTGGNNYSRDFVLQYFNGTNPIGIASTEREPSVYAFNQARDLMKQAITNTLVGAAYSDLTLTPDPLTGFNTSPFSCADVRSNVDNLVGIVTVSIGAGNTSSLPASPNLGYFNLSVGIGTTVSPGGVKCARDLSFLVEALSTDVFTGGNKYIRDFTLQYFDKNGNPITNGLVGETAESVTAFNALRDYSKKAITNQLNRKNLSVSAGISSLGGGGPVIPVSPSGNPNACTDVQYAIDTLIGIASSVIGAGSTSLLSTFNENLGISTTNTCARDLGYLVEAIATDIFTGGNNYSREYTLQYFDAGNNFVFLDGENEQSVYAFKTLGEYAKKAITNQLNYKEVGISSGKASYAGAGTSIPVLPSGNPNACTDVQNAIDTLVGIVTSVIGTGSTSSLPLNANLGISTTNKCARDLGYLVEAIATDIFTGGNKYSRDYTLQYFDAGNNFVFLDGENDQSVYAFNSLREYSKKAIANQLNRKNLFVSAGISSLGSGGPTIPILPSGNPDSCTDVQYAIDTLVGIVTSVVGVGSTAILSTFSENLGISTTNKCARDLAYFVDAISTDVFTGGNKYSRDFTKQYFDANNNLIYLNGENIQSAYTFNSARDYAKKAITNQLNYKELDISAGFSTYPNVGTFQPNLPSGNPNSCADVQSNINNLVEIVTNVIGVGTTGNIGFLNTFSENTGTFTDGAKKCARDIGYIINATVEDLRGYTNANIIDATKKYFNYDGTLNYLIGEEQESIAAFNATRDYMKLALNNQLNVKDLTVLAGISSIGGGGPIIPILPSGSPNACSDVRYTIDTNIEILTTAINSASLSSVPTTPSLSSTEFSLDVGIATQPHYYAGGGTAKLNVIRPFDGQAAYFNELFYVVKTLNIVNGGSGYTDLPTITIDPPDTPWGVQAQAVPTIENGVLVSVDMVSNGRGYRVPPKVTISSGINTAVATAELVPEYYTVQKSTEIVNGVCIVTFNENVPFVVGIGTEVSFFKQSRVLATGHSFEFIGAGTDIATALPFTGGVPIEDNETDSRNGGLVVYSSTNQSGNFKIGDGVKINQNTGSITGNAYTKSLFSTMTPFILSLGGF